MENFVFVIILLMTCDFILSQQSRSARKNPMNVDSGKEPGRAAFVLADNVVSVKSKESEKSKFYRNHNGIWKFNLVTNLVNRPQDYYKVSFSDKECSTIRVPFNWELKGYDTPIHIP